MSPTHHPILFSLAKPLPEKAPSRVMIENGASLQDIAGQAKMEWACLAAHHQEKKPAAGPGWLLENGYADWLKEADEEDQTRMLGWLDMIHEMARDLAEEEKEQALEDEEED